MTFEKRYYLVCKQKKIIGVWHSLFVYFNTRTDYLLLKQVSPYFLVEAYEFT